eukprot:TRINITY_DN35296_c0_g1_i1.p1 TRINITY_DN35296_c0_g1~~TRINITY_DN35296_c0_g1_i1.p1  ORF type:complete len:116 (-),score=8.94 TRINITY_DN35296_c0_g1_i1:10-357(-)
MKIPLFFSKRSGGYRPRFERQISLASGFVKREEALRNPRHRQPDQCLSASSTGSTASFRPNGRASSIIVIPLAFFRWNATPTFTKISLPPPSRSLKIGRAVQQECRDRSRMPSSA